MAGSCDRRGGLKDFKSLDGSGDSSSCRGMGRKKRSGKALAEFEY